MWSRFIAQCVEWVNSAWRQITWTNLSADTEIGRRSRVLMAAQVIILAIGTLGEVEYLGTRWKQFDPSLIVTIGGFLCLLLAYFLNRRGYFRVAAGITISALTITIYSLFWLMREDAYSAGILLYLMLPILLSNFVLSWRWYILAAILILAGCLGFLFQPNVVDYLYYLVISATLLGIFNFHNQMLEDRRVSALQESEKRYHHILDSMLEGCQIIDFNWRYVYVNNVVADQGRSRVDELLGHTMMEMYPGIENSELFTVLRRCMEKRLPARMENQFTFPDGSVGWFELSIQPAREGIFILSTDVTERKSAEEALRFENQRFQRFINANIVGIVIADATGKIIAANDYYLNVLGVTRQDFEEGRVDWRKFTPPEWLPADEKAIRELSERSVCEPYEKEYVRLNGTRVPVIITDAMLPGPESQIAAFVLDITERKRAEEELRAINTRLKKVLEVETVGVMFWDLTTGVMTDANDSFLNLMGFSRRELEAGELTWQKLTPPEYMEASLAEIRKFQISGRVGPYEKEYFRKDGARQWLVFAGSSLGGNTCVEFCVDISDRKQAEGKLRASEERFRDLIKNGRDNISLLASDGTLIWESPTEYPTLGYEPNQFLERNIFELMHPDDLAWTQSMFEQIAHAPGQSIEGSFRLRHADGSWRWIEATATNLLDVASVQAIVVNYRDVTERKRAEEALRSSEEKLQLFIQYAPASLAMFDRDMRYLAASQNWITDYQLGDTEILGRSHYEIFPEITEQLKDVHRRGLNGEVVRSDEDRFVRHNGVMQWLKWEVHPWHAEDGSVGGIIIFSEDITKRKKAEEDQRRHLRELHALNVVSSALRSAQTINEALPILLDQTLIALECEAGEISLYDPTDGLLHVAQARGWFLDLLAPAIRPGEGITGTVFTSGELYHSIEFATDPLLHPGFVKKIPPGWGGAAVPLRAANETVGVLFISNSHPKELSDEAIKLLRALSEMAGAMLHRMRLNEETARRLAQLQGLRTIDQAITASFNKHVALNILLEQTVIHLGVDAAGILLLDGQSHILEYALGYGFRTSAYKRSKLRLGEGIAGRAALECQVIQLPHLKESGNKFSRAPLLADEEFETCFAAPLISKGQVLGTLEVFHRRVYQPDDEWLDFLETLAGQAAIAIDNAFMFETLQRSNTDLSLAYEATIEGWSRAMDLRDKETEGHTQRVTELTMDLARAMNVNEAEMIHIRRGALLHDMGKMGVPDSILLKPDKLTDEEWTVMRRHPEFAYEMLRSIEFLRPALDIPYCHHEKWNGSGYPRALKGEEIPIAARIFAVVDVWDALTSDRPYRKGWSQEQAIEYIRNNAGSHFDPKVVEMFLQLVKDKNRK